KERHRSDDPYAFVAIAIFLTVFQVRDVSTPLAMLAVTAIPVVLLLRTRRAYHAELSGYALIATCFAFALYVVPDTERPSAEILTLLAAIAAVLAALFRGLGHLLRGRAREGFPAEAAVCYDRVSAVAILLAVISIVANTVLLPDLPAETLGTILAAFALVLAAVLAFRRAVAGGSAYFTHLGLACLLALYAFLAMRTEVIDLLAGYHVHVLATAGAMLIMIGDPKGGRRRAFVSEGLLLPVPAVIVSLAALLGFTALTGRASSALFLASAAYGLAARRLGRMDLGWISGALVNLALFAFWRFQGIVDPEFYGVPAGLSLLAGAEITRDRMSRSWHLALFLAGVALLYGSVGVQVLRVEAPTHALVLFGLGLATVSLGFHRNRNDLLVAGTTVVVLDVVAYLARHGFEESFLGAALLVLAGLTVLGVATLAARRRHAGDKGGGPDTS
ncbi:MAG: hypothetical protein ACYS99_22890, partial [Planctomycetota bacterium]